jgi:hypothetical protein
MKEVVIVGKKQKGDGTGRERFGKMLRSLPLRCVLLPIPSDYLGFTINDEGT